MKLVVFKLQQNETIHKYSFVEDSELINIPNEIVLGSTNVPKDIALTKELAEKLTQKILNGDN